MVRSQIGTVLLYVTCLWLLWVVIIVLLCYYVIIVLNGAIICMKCRHVGINVNPLSLYGQWSVTLLLHSCLGRFILMGIGFTQSQSLSPSDGEGSRWVSSILLHHLVQNIFVLRGLVAIVSDKHPVILLNPVEQKVSDTFIYSTECQAHLDANQSHFMETF